MTKLIEPIDIAYKKAEDAMEEALFLGQQEDFLRYKKEVEEIRGLIRRGEQYLVNF